LGDSLSFNFIAEFDLSFKPDLVFLPGVALISLSSVNGSPQGSLLPLIELLLSQALSVNSPFHSSSSSRSFLESLFLSLSSSPPFFFFFFPSVDLEGVDPGVTSVVDLLKLPNLELFALFTDDASSSF
jgi:hypothetical protein